MPKMSMEVEFISRETIKPSSLECLHPPNPTNLSLLDQLLAAACYFPVILFYEVEGTHPNVAEISAGLKRSLSETLSIFYPLAGRVKDDLYIDNNFEEGVPFLETKVKNTRLLDFLQHPQINMLNQFIPFTPFGYIPKSETTPLIAIQMNSFECGGIALGVCFLHKIFDATSASTFLKSWTANHINTSTDTTEDNIIVSPNDLWEASLRFPPIEPSLLPQQDDEVWCDQSNCGVVKRFVFKAKAIEALRAKARSERVLNPTRIETVSSFIWKFYSAAAREVSDSPRLSMSTHVVNIRQRTSPRLSGDSIGNLYLYAFATHDLADTDNMGLDDLVSLTRQAVAKVNVEFVKRFEGEKGHKEAFKHMDSIEQVLSQKPEALSFSSWMHNGFDNLDFGWGNPLWTGILGGVDPGFHDLILFKESGPKGEDIEAWIIMDETRISIMERHPDFLAFATPNPSIFS